MIKVTNMRGVNKDPNNLIKIKYLYAICDVTIISDDGSMLVDGCHVMKFDGVFVLGSLIDLFDGFRDSMEKAVLEVFNKTEFKNNHD